MKRKMLWLVVSCLMVVALVLASCGPAEEEEEEVALPSIEQEEEEEETIDGEPTPTAETVKLTLTKEDGTVIEKIVEKPRYGGVLVQSWAVDAVTFDDAVSPVWTTLGLTLTNEDLVKGDWAKGPAGTGEAGWYHYAIWVPQALTGCLAESWEIADDQTVIYHIRKGVRFHDKPPVNGREMDAEDVVFSLKRIWELPTSWHMSTYPWEANIESVTAPDKWTVVLKCLPGKTGMVYEVASDMAKIVPHEVIEQYGDMNQWENVCGTGPFVLTDYVSGGSVTLERNPAYWMKDPLHPDNQLPYLDGVKYLVIPDLSTRMAAIRAGKVDLLAGLYGSVGWEDAASLKQTNPELKWVRYLSGGSSAIMWRVDKPELPFHDKRVRQALFMAVDHDAIAQHFFGGEAEVLAWPILPIPEFMDMYIPLDELPETVQELYQYNPERAKQLLAEAGYPDGFSTEVICTSTGVDLVSIYKAFWEKVGVNVALDVKEYAVVTSMVFRKTHKEMGLYGTNPTIPLRFTRLRKGEYPNLSMVDDPVIEDAYTSISADYFNEPERRKTMKETVPYILDECYLLPAPTPYIYHFWQPWLKGYQGEGCVGYYGAMIDFAKYIWIDQDLKEEMTGRR